MQTLLTSYVADLRVKMNIILLIGFSSPGDSAPADLFIAGEYAH